ncbi:MAG TPA: ABC transporter ATP-binding protein [Spirochaetota bacterium]|nr:ABC transporter ATP-binding protein [Spirochaetota bacterium]
MNILNIENLCMRFDLDEPLLAVRNLSLSIEEGETVGLVGESGCGKTMTAYSILRLIQSPGRITGGKIVFKGRDLLALDENEIRSVRGKDISMIFQEPMSSLNPVMSIGRQISECIELHLGMTRNDAKPLVIELLRQVGIPDAESRYNSYPHELSGGMRQRVMIAMALSANPSILIADEPTTALDVTIQAQILELMLDIQEKRKMSLLIISHDLGLIGNVADRIAIMYAGEICEIASAKEIFSSPLHPYTEGLFAAVPRIGAGSGRLNTIKGTVPSIHTEPEGCAYLPRCPKGDASCAKSRITLSDKGNAHFVRCIKV